MFHIKTQQLIIKGTLSILTLSSLMFATTLADDYLYVNATHLNVRAASTFRSAIVATIDSGYKVTVLETKENGWKKVLLENGKIGYINGRYLTAQEPYFEKALGANYTVNVPRAFVRGDGLIKKVAVLAKGDRLEILDQKVFLGKWLRVRVLSSTHDLYNNRVGYVSKKLVTVEENSAYVDMVSEEENPTIDVTTNESVQLNSAPAENTTVSTEDTNSTTQNSSSGTTTGSGGAEDADLGNLLGDLLK